MSITFKGKLSDESLLEKVDVQGYNKVQISIIDYLLASVILIIPVLCGIQLLIDKYQGSIITLLVLM